MDNSNQSINFGIEHNGATSYFLNLSNNGKREFFLRFLSPKKGGPERFFYREKNKNAEIITGVDHVSFHEDGTIQIAYFTKNKKRRTIPVLKLPNTIKSMPQLNYASLLAISIYNTSNILEFFGTPNPLLLKNSNNLTIPIDPGKNESFSIVFFLVGSMMNYETTLNNLFPGMFDFSQSPYILNYFGDETKIEINDDMLTTKDTGLLIAFTKKLIPKGTQRAEFEKDLAKKVDRMENPFGLRLALNDEMVRDLI